MTTPIALTIAGSDSSGGAGIQADLKTFSALGVYGASAVTALTAQNTRGVENVFPVPPDVVAAQINAVLSDLQVKAIKTGMLANTAILRAAVEALTNHAHLPLVVDPIMISQTGQSLLVEDAIATLRAYLLPHAVLLTPNLHEAAKLLDTHVARNENEMIAQGRALFEWNPKAVLIKGGHGQGAESVDFYIDRTETLRLAAPRIATRHTHGSGCSLSAAITAYLARGLPMKDAVQKAKSWLHEAIRAADQLHIGSGAGPVHHFHALWGKDN